MVLHRTHHKPMAKMVGVTVRREVRWTSATGKTGNRLLATVAKPTTKARLQANFANAYWEVVKADKTPGSQ